MEIQADLVVYRQNQSYENEANFNKKKSRTYLIFEFKETEDFKVLIVI